MFRDFKYSINYTINLHKKLQQESIFTKSVLSHYMLTEKLVTTSNTEVPVLGIKTCRNMQYWFTRSSYMFYISL